MASVIDALKFSVVIPMRNPGLGYLKPQQKPPLRKRNKAVLNLLIKLAGRWRPKSKGVDLVCESSSQIVKQFKVEGANTELRILESKKLFENLLKEKNELIAGWLSEQSALEKIIEGKVAILSEVKCSVDKVMGCLTWMPLEKIIQELEKIQEGDTVEFEAETEKNLIYTVWRSTGKKLSIGIISPYTAQVVTIKDTIGRKYDNLNGFAIKAKSIHGFQGGEEDIIIISTIASYSKVKDGRVMKVEAREYAGESSFSRSGSTWKSQSEVDTKRTSLRQLFVYAMKQHVSHLKRSNFCTHAGVLRLAQSVIDILCHYFPQSIDALAPETNLIYGEASVLLLLKPGSDIAGWKLWPVSHLITYGVIGDPSRGRAKAPFGWPASVIDALKFSVVIPMRNPGLGYLKPQQKPPLRKRNKGWTLYEVLRYALEHNCNAYEEGKPFVC
nr:uncharacterized protein LOC109161799 isoform X1 [Ipomoea trifida]GLL47920.1 uncharacterized protein LOC109161799 isoform X1 [Ipomoea trifida]